MQTMSTAYIYQPQSYSLVSGAISVSTCIYIEMFTYIHHIYIYIYISSSSVYTYSMSIFIYVYVYIYIYIPLSLSLPAPSPLFVCLCLSHSHSHTLSLSFCLSLRLWVLPTVLFRHRFQRTKTEVHIIITILFNAGVTRAIFMKQSSGRFRSPREPKSSPQLHDRLFLCQPSP